LYGWWFYQIVTAMNSPVQPLRVPSLKEACVQRLEELILSGELKAGEKLSSERDLALQLGISRPVLHEALVDLAAKGLVTIEPRRGVYINDFRTNGSVAILSTLLVYHQGRLDPALVQSLMDMRQLVETETARLAAVHRTAEHLRQFQELLSLEAKVDPTDAAGLTDLDFSFHLHVALASGNLVYPLIINSFKNVYTSLTGAFFQHFAGSERLSEVLAYHRKLVTAIQKQDENAAGEVMQEMLAHGKQQLLSAHPL
jgi:GntR family transcriptional regulator, transcriptional repressor for pyruvate dehydrogenase complex